MLFVAQLGTSAPVAGASRPSSTRCQHIGVSYFTDVIQKTGLVDKNLCNESRVVFHDSKHAYRVVRLKSRAKHTNFELTSLEGQQVSRHELSTGGELSPLATQVVQIPGVETIILRPYGIGIHTAMAFDWEDISPAAKEVLLWVGKAFGVDQKPKPNKPKRRVVQTEA